LQALSSDDSLCPWCFTLGAKAGREHPGFPRFRLCSAGAAKCETVPGPTGVEALSGTAGIPHGFGSACRTCNHAQPDRAVRLQLAASRQKEQWVTACPLVTGVSGYFRHYIISRLLWGLRSHRGDNLCLSLRIMCMQAFRPTHGRPETTVSCAFVMCHDSCCFTAAWTSLTVCRL
jgi:hypothetical protein